MSYYLPLQSQETCNRSSILVDLVKSEVDAAVKKLFKKLKEESLDHYEYFLDTSCNQYNKSLNSYDCGNAFCRIGHFMPGHSSLIFKLERILLLADDVDQACGELEEVSVEIFAMAQQEKKDTVEAFLNGYGETLEETEEDCKFGNLDLHWDYDVVVQAHACVFAFVFAQGGNEEGVPVRLGEILTNRQLTSLGTGVLDSSSEDISDPASIGSLEYYAKSLKRVRYSMKPINWDIDEMGEMLEIDRALEELGISGHASFRNNDPILFGASVIQQDSEETPFRVQRAFGHNGLTHTFNAGRFWDKYQKTPSMETFYREMLEVKGVEDPPVWHPQSNGPSFTFLAIVDMPYSGGGLMTLHHHLDVPSSFDRPIVVERGKAYSVSVTPTVSRVDSNVERLDPEEKKCLSPHDRHNLTVFKSYSHSACVYECRLRIAAGPDAMNCSAPEHPRLDEASPVCSVDNSPLFGFYMAHVNPTRDCSCPRDCDTVHYEFYTSVFDLDVNAMCGHTDDVLGLSPYWTLSNTTMPMNAITLLREHGLWVILSLHLIPLLQLVFQF